MELKMSKTYSHHVCRQDKVAAATAQEIKVKEQEYKFLCFFGEAGFDARFGKTGGKMVEDGSSEVIPIHRREDVYYVKMWVKALDDGGVAEKNASFLPSPPSHATTRARTPGCSRSPVLQSTQRDLVRT